jgi:hypothetical protein
LPRNFIDIFFFIKLNLSDLCGLEEFFSN